MLSNPVSFLWAIAVLIGMMISFYMSDEFVNFFKNKKPETILFCPDPANLPGNILSNNDGDTIELNKIAWTIHNEGSFMQATDLMRLKEAYISKQGLLICNYDWGNPNITVGKKLSLWPPQTYLVKPVGLYWEDGADNLKICRSANFEACAFKMF